jgi:hypothetical protein
MYPRNMVCFRYTIVNTLQEGADDDDNDNNNTDDDAKSEFKTALYFNIQILSTITSCVSTGKVSSDLRSLSLDSLTLKMTALCSSETSVNIYQSKGCNISEDLNNQR